MRSCVSIQLKIYLTQSLDKSIKEKLKSGLFPSTGSERMNSGDVSKSGADAAASSEQHANRGSDDMFLVIQEEWSSVSNDSDHVIQTGAAACVSYTFAESAFDKAVARGKRANFGTDQGTFLQMTVVPTNFILNGSSKRWIKNRLWGECTYWYPISLSCSTGLTARAWARADYFLNVLLVYQSGVKHRSRFPQNLRPHWFLCRDTWSKSVGLLKWLTLDKWLFLHQSPHTGINCYRTPHTPGCVKFKDDIFVRKR